MVHPKSRDPKDPAPLKVKEVRIEERRYVVCVNEDEVKKDRADREAIVARQGSPLDGLAILQVA